LRPQQWVKNAVVLAGLVFAEITDQPRSVLAAVLALIAFVFASAAIYILNDLRDTEADRRHPQKRLRPLAAGEVDAAAAGRLAGVLGIAALAIGLVVTPGLGAIIGAYLLLMIAYTAWIKRVAILDVIVIAVGFVLRAVGGAVAVDVPISPWLLVCAFLLALFLGFGKRRAEFVGLGLDAARHRVALGGYTGPLLDQLVRITAGAALVTYAIYTVEASSVPGNGAMLLTVPLVAFAIFRYLYLIYGRGLGGSPESLLFRDRWLLGAVALWAALALALMQMGDELGRWLG
jgi:4-hydroxybenzoate polyprenyltransferase